MWEEGGKDQDMRRRSEGSRCEKREGRVKSWEEGGKGQNTEREKDKKPGK